VFFISILWHNAKRTFIHQGHIL